jgi:hypothetical protein
VATALEAAVRLTRHLTFTGESPVPGRPDVSGTATLGGGTAGAVLGPFATTGTRHVEVRYLGDDVTRPGSATTTITVTSSKP